MSKNIVIADSDKGFSTILAEGLNSHPSFRATAVPTATRALQLAVEHPIDLVIIDMGLSDAPPLKLAKAIREAKPTIALMIIPLFGEDVPQDIQALGIQGKLPKPFFVGDLPKVVGQALGMQLEAEIPPPPTIPVRNTANRRLAASPPPPLSRSTLEADSPPQAKPEPVEPVATEPERTSRSYRPTLKSRTAPVEALPSWKLQQLRKNKNAVIDLLKGLNTEIRAEVILLTAGTELIAKAGTMAEDRVQDLAQLVAESAESAAQVATFLGERDAQFEQSLHEGAKYRLYSYSLGQGVVLSLALGANVPLGILRLQTKQTGQKLLKYIQ